MKKITRKKERVFQENRASFFKRLVLKITPADMKELESAYEFAKYGHRTQVRDSGERYFEHPRAVALILIDELRITDVGMLIAAFLHDILEDAYLLTPDRMRNSFVRHGERVASLVSGVTKPKKNDPRFKTEKQRNKFYKEQVKQASLEVKLLKLVDRLHNTRTLGGCSLEKQKRKIEETRRDYFPLINDVAAEHPEIAKYLLTQLEEAIAKLS